MSDYHVIQLTGSTCGPYNCAAASGSDSLAAMHGPQLTADQFRSVAGVSCAPGAHSPSGGLYISDVERVFKHYGKEIDYGRTPSHQLPVHWTTAQGLTKLKLKCGMVMVGDYDALPVKWRASATFRGDHSTYVHDYRESDKTVCWHDPLRFAPIRIPWVDAAKYWQKPGSQVRGLAGFTMPPKPAPPVEIDEWEAPIRPRPGDADGKQPFLVYYVESHTGRPLRITKHDGTRTGGDTYRVRPPIKAVRGTGFPSSAKLPKGLCRLLDAVPHLPAGGYLDVALCHEVD